MDKAWEKMNKDSLSNSKAQSQTSWKYKAELLQEAKWFRR